jgi:hypothetical protein
MCYSKKGGKSITKNLIANSLPIRLDLAAAVGPGLCLLCRQAPRYM